jgi:multidrug efflux pump subunit AcrA (membrane-fusion protein)
MNEPEKSKRLPTILMISALVAILGIGIYYFGFHQDRVETEDAYVNGNLVRLTPQVNGTVIGINIDETQFVKRGQVLVQVVIPRRSAPSRPCSHRRARIWSGISPSLPSMVCLPRL